MRTSGDASLVGCVVSPHPLAAQHLLLHLGREPGLIAVLAEDFLAGPTECRAVVFIVDHGSPTFPLGEYLRRLKARFSRAKYIVIDREQNERDIVHWLLNGVHGFVEYQMVEDTLLSAVHAVAAGQLWVTAEALQAYVMCTATSKHQRPFGWQTTTPREAQILELVRLRFSNKEIADTLNIQESTIKFHLSNIFGKLQVRSRQELARAEEKSPIWEAMTVHGRAKVGA